MLDVSEQRAKELIAKGFAAEGKATLNNSEAEMLANKDAVTELSRLSEREGFVKAIPHNSGVRIAQQDFSSGCTNKSR